MKKLLFIFLSTVVSLQLLSGQESSGTLKVFSEEPVIVYVDQVQYPEYGNITLVPGTHYVKAINKDEVRIYSEIVTIRAGEVTSVLIEVPHTQPSAVQSNATMAPQGQNQGVQARPGQAAVTYGQTAVAENKEPEADKTMEEEAPAVPVPTIDIGQTDGKLPADMNGAFGLAFGMSTGDVDRIMSPKSAQAQRNTTYNVYAIPKGSSFCIVECRFIDKKLFQIIVGYVSTYTDKSKLKLSKGEVPVPEFNQMLNDVTAVYGSPGKAEKIFLSGYSEDDGQLLEALKKKKALLLYTWTEPSTGNNIMVGLGYTTAPLAATIYTSGPMGNEAAARKLRIHAYDYHKSFKDNYFSN